MSPTHERSLYTVTSVQWGLDLSSADGSLLKHTRFLFYDNCRPIIGQSNWEQSTAWIEDKNRQEKNYKVIDYFS